MFEFNSKLYNLFLFWISQWKSLYFDGYLFRSISHFNNLNFLATHWVCFPKVAINNQFQNKTGTKKNIKELKAF